MAMRFTRDLLEEIIDFYHCRLYYAVYIFEVLSQSPCVLNFKIY